VFNPALHKRAGRLQLEADVAQAFDSR
jgi:hypothetical protein